MEFWGVEVKPGETVKCNPGDEKYLHLSQASLGEVKKDKGNENIPLFVKFKDQKLVIGTLSTEKCAQISYDLVFEEEFELSHNWKKGSVFFVGYKTIISDEGPDELSDDIDSDVGDKDPQLSQKVNGKSVSKDELPKSKANAPKADSAAAKPKVKTEEPKKDEEDDDDDDSDEDESDDEMLGDGDESSDEEESSEEESSDEEDEATPKKAEIGKKRQTESANKTPVFEKKAKFVTPSGSQKTGGAGGKKGGHTSTPYPAKQAAKVAPGTKQQTPKSGGSVSCKTCSKTFNSDNALQAHSKAKHVVK